MRLEHHPPLRLRQSGFSLLEMTIVLAVLAVVLAGALPFLTETTKSKDADTTLERLNAIEEALLVHYITQGLLLPCPAIPGVDISDPTFGEPVPEAFCGNSNLIDGVAPTSWGEIVGGSVPVRVLDLPDEYAFDGWGRRFTYYIDNSVSDATEFPTGDLTIRADSASADDLSITASYVIVSHGPNGNCAYLRSGERMAPPSVNPDEINNCDVADEIFIKRSAGYGTPATPSDDNFYDDVVRFRPRTLVQYAFGGAAVFPASCPADDEPLVWDNDKPGGPGWECQSLSAP